MGAFENALNEECTKRQVIDLYREALQTQRRGFAERDARIEALETREGEVIILAIMGKLSETEALFTEFMEDGPEEGIEEKWRGIVSDAVKRLDDEPS